MEFTLQRFIKNDDDTITPIKDSSFSFSQDEFTALLKFLSDLKFLDFSDKERFVVEDNKQTNRKILLNLTKPNPNKVLVDKNLGEIIDKLSHLTSSEREDIVEKLKDNIFSKYDLDILSGRKDGLEIFRGDGNLIYETFDPIDNPDDLKKYLLDQLDDEGMEIFNEIKGKKIGRIQTSKGCVARCTFCQRAQKGYRVFEPDYFEEQVLRLKNKYNVGALIVDDENFGSNKVQAYACARIIADIFPLAGDLVQDATL